MRIQVSAAFGGLLNLGEAWGNGTQGPHSVGVPAFLGSDFSAVRG